MNEGGMPSEYQTHSVRYLRGHCSFFRHRSFEVIAEDLDVGGAWGDPWQVALRRR